MSIARLCRGLLNILVFLRRPSSKRVICSPDDKQPVCPSQDSTEASVPEVHRHAMIQASAPEVHRHVIIQDPCVDPTSVKLFIKRGMQRFTKLATASKSRLAGYGIRQALGEHWATFVGYIWGKFRSTWIQQFGAIMACEGSIDGTPCPHKCKIDPTCRSDLKKMSSLHLDHSVEVYDICARWLSIIQKQAKPLQAWDDGVNGELICQLLFGVVDHPNFSSSGSPLWRANVHFRCGKSKWNKHNYCHDQCRRHVGFELKEGDLERGSH